MASKLTNPYLRVLVFLSLYFVLQVLIAEFGIQILLRKWMPALDFADRAQLREAIEAHRWPLTRLLWPAQNLALVGLVFALRSRIDRASVAALGLRPFRTSLLGRGILLGTFLAFLMTLPLLLAPSNPVERQAGLPSFLEVGVIFLLAAFSGELAMRGYVLSNLLVGDRVVVAIIGSAIAFALFQEVGPDSAWVVAFLNLVLIGILLGLLRLAWGSLWPAIGFQIGWSVALGPVLGFPVSGHVFRGLLAPREFRSHFWSDISGGGFGPEGGLLCTLVVAAACLWITTRSPWPPRSMTAEERPDA